MGSPDDISGVEFYPDSQEFVIVRNNGTISRMYSNDTDAELFLKVIDWAEAGVIDYEIVQ